MAKHYHIHNGIKQYPRWGRRVMIFVSTLLLIGLPIAAKQYSGNLLPNSFNKNDQPAWLTEPQAGAESLSEQIPWPTYGHAAYGVPKNSVYAASVKEEKSVPIASLAKTITALAILDKYPLNPGEQGPNITLTPEDERLFNEYLAKDGVVLPVKTGEQISQYQAMQGMLLVSANNLSDTLANWAFGSVEAYTEYANNLLKQKGLKYTVVADASGFSPNTVSTSEEMTKIGDLYMQNPVLREITMQERAEIPLSGVIQNANSFANEPGIYGIKIGNTDEAGRTYMAAKITGTDQDEKIAVAVVLGANNLATAAKDALKVLKAGDQAKQP